ncbi:MAG TPA: DUF4139 domain-containing protein [Flavobacteriales bacterium]|nr:DUF4139 domain-containing protein [Flavobacteriales bacterium]
MKSIIAYGILHAVTTSILPPQAVDIADSKIQKVTVFLAGAQVVREGTFMIQPGVSELSMSGVSPYVDPNSLQARGIGDFTIMDVKFDVEYPQPDPVETDPNKIPADVLKKMRLLGDSIENVSYQLEEIRTKKEVRNMERQMLLNNGTVKGVGKVNDSIQLLKSAMDYFHVKMTEINMDLYNMKRKEDGLTKVYNGMNNRLTLLRNWQANNNMVVAPVKGPIYKLVVTVNAEAPVRGKIEVGYLVSQAGWVPSYDIRAKDVNSPVELNYKANVYQNSGEEWTKVPLTLSSNNPYINQTKPEMTPWYITSYYVQEPYLRKNQAGYYDKKVAEDMDYERAAAPASALGEMQENLSSQKPAGYAQDFTVKTQTMVSAEFEIKLPYTIHSNNKPHLVSIAKEELKAKYYLALVPKLDKNAFMIADILDWEGLDLLPATANLYYDGTFVGKSYIDPSAMEDTLKLALGRDNNISAIRKKLKEKDKEKIIGDSKVKEVAYEINIRNSHAYAVDLIIEDQVPVSNLQDVKVEILDKGKANLNVYNGFLTWRTKLKPAGSEKITFGYAIKYDKDKTLSMVF